MRRGFGAGVLILSLLIAIGIGVGAYNVGYNHGLEANGSVQVIHYVGGYGWGFFPFGLILFPLFLFAIFGLARKAMWGRHGDGHDHHGPMGPGSTGSWGAREQLFEDWHRRQHEPANGEGGSAGGEPASV
jgi:hypothetical protein